MVSAVFQPHPLAFCSFFPLEDLFIYLFQTFRAAGRSRHGRNKQATKPGVSGHSRSSGDSACREHPTLEALLPNASASDYRFKKKHAGKVLKTGQPDLCCSHRPSFQHCRLWAASPSFSPQILASLVTRFLVWVSRCKEAACFESR